MTGVTCQHCGQYDFAGPKATCCRWEYRVDGEKDWVSVSDLLAPRNSYALAERLAEENFNHNFNIEDADEFEYTVEVKDLDKNIRKWVVTARAQVEFNAEEVMNEN